MLDIAIFASPCVVCGLLCLVLDRDNDDRWIIGGIMTGAGGGVIYIIYTDDSLYYGLIGMVVSILVSLYVSAEICRLDKKYSRHFRVCQDEPTESP